MQNEILLGSHVSFGSPNYFVGSINEALNYGENTFMFYTGAPQNNIRTPLEKCKIDEGLELLKKHNINPNSLVVHAPYIINLGNSLNENIFKFSKEILQNEINRTSAFKVKNLVLHPGLHVKAGTLIGLNKIVEGLTAEIRLPLDTIPATKLTVSSCLTFGDDGSVGVKTVNDENKVEFYPIEIIKEEKDGLWVSGLPKTANVIVAGGEFVSVGEVVNPKFPKQLNTETTEIIDNNEQQ